MRLDYNRFSFNYLVPQEVLPEPFVTPEIRGFAGLGVESNEQEGFPMRRIPGEPWQDLAEVAVEQRDSQQINHLIEQLDRDQRSEEPQKHASQQR